MGFAKDFGQSHFCQNNNVDNCDCALSTTTHSVFTPSQKYQLLSWPNLVFALHSVKSQTFDIEPIYKDVEYKKPKWNS